MAAAAAVPLFERFMVVGMKAGGGSGAGSMVPEVLSEFQGCSTMKFPGNVVNFCMPGGAPAALDRMKAVDFTFVLTNKDGCRVYGVCRQMLPYGPGGRYDVGRRFPECLCFLTRRPYVPLFEWLLQVLQVRRWTRPDSVTPFLEAAQARRPVAAQGGGSPILTIPSVGGGAYDFTYTIPTRDSPVPLTDLGVGTLLTHLNPDLLRFVLGAILSERRVIFLSGRLDILSRCIHAALALIHPFGWQHIFVPILPSALVEVSGSGWGCLCVCVCVCMCACV